MRDEMLTLAAGRGLGGVLMIRDVTERPAGRASGFRRVPVDLSR